MNAVSCSAVLCRAVPCCAVLCYAAPVHQSGLGLGLKEQKAPAGPWIWNVCDECRIGSRCVSAVAAKEATGGSIVDAALR